MTALWKRISTALGVLLATTAAPALAQQPTPNQMTADAVARAIRTSPAQAQTRLAIEVRAGVVVLEGTVTSATAKTDVLARVRRVAGVAGVTDRIRVTGDSRVTPAQYQVGEPMPNRIAYGGLLHGHGHGHGGGAAAGPMMDGAEMAEGAPIMNGGMAGAPGMDGPLPEGPAGMTGAGAGAMPNYAWPSYAPYSNYSAVGYPTAYPWQAWPNIGPFYPYPEVPLDWRAVTLRWDDGIWWLDFRKHYTRPFFTPYPFGIFGY